MKRFTAPTSANELLEEVALISGIPLEELTCELRPIFADLGICPENLTLQKLRAAMAQYVHQVMVLENPAEKQEN